METEAEKIAGWEREEREPTPLPWRIERGLQWDDKEPLVRIVGANDDTVADNTQFYPHDIKEADAEFIVPRVNAFDALVAALEKERETFEVIRYGFPVTEYGPFSANGAIMSACRDAVDRIDAALALARGGKWMDKVDKVIAAIVAEL